MRRSLVILAGVLLFFWQLVTMCTRPGETFDDAEDAAAMMTTPADVDMTPLPTAKPTKKPTAKPTKKPTAKPTDNPDSGGGGGNAFTGANGVPPTTKGRPPAGAMVAKKLSDFAEHDNSLVFPRNTPGAEEIENITEIGPGTFNFLLRFRGNPWSKYNPGGTKGAWYDGDRDLEWNEGKRDGEYHDKSRAEMCCLNDYGKKKGPKYQIGETWDIATTVRLDPNFVPSKGYCMIMQPIFDGSYVILNGLDGDTVSGNLTMFENGIGPGQKVARSFKIKRGEWLSLVVRVKFGKDGMYQLSVDGDEFKGLKNVDTTKAKQPWRSKWGLYGTATKDVKGNPMKDMVVQHTNMYIRKVSG